VIVDHFLGECFHFTGLGLVEGEPGGGNFVDIGLRHVLQCFLVAGAESGVRLSLARSLSLRGAGCLGLYANGAEQLLQLLIRLAAFSGFYSCAYCSPDGHGTGKFQLLQAQPADKWRLHRSV
jgi:hypothetical protein